MMRRTIRQSVLSLALLAGAALGCGGSDSTGPGAGNGSCTITLTGAQSASPACSGITAVWTSDVNTFEFGFFTSDATPTVIVSLSSPGEPTATTYHPTDAGALGSVAITNGSSSWLAQTADTSSATAATGSYTLTLSSVSTIVSENGTKVYRVHGTLNATVPAAVGTDATGTVTLNSVF